MTHREKTPGFSLDSILRHPQQLESISPCQAGCVIGGDVRGWIAEIAQAGKLGRSREEALERAWRRIIEVNPFPATTGRICPHPCDQACNRSEKDGGVAVNALERFVGDWALERGLALEPLGSEAFPERVAVVGAGPAGLSFAYQMARRGYRVTVYERAPAPGGMLLRGIPAYRLPESVLNAEIERIVDLGVEIRLGVGAGTDVPLADLRESYDAVFLGIGAQLGRKLGVPGEDGAGCLSGVDYLRGFNAGAPPELGRHVTVVGGGNTAVDAARAARRNGCRVTLVYRRTRAEMPAIASEVDDALAEGVELVELAAPLEVLRDAGRVRGLRLQRMRLGEPDGSGRRRPEVVPGSERELRSDGVIAAVSQEPDWEGLGDVRSAGGWAHAEDRFGSLDEGVWSGGDARGLGIAGLAIAQGRLGAEAVHARLRGLPLPDASNAERLRATRVQLDLYETRPRAEAPRLTPAEGLARPQAEVAGPLAAEAAFAEAERCLSCGSCMGCQNCWMYCNAGGFTRVDEVAPGAYFLLDLSRCEGCGKCIEVCPCGFLTLEDRPAAEP